MTCAFETEEEMTPATTGVAGAKAVPAYPPPLTDYGNAERLVTDHGDDLLHVNGIGWLTWDGRRFLRDETGEVERRAKDTVRGIYAEASGAASDSERKAIVKHALGSEHVSRVLAIITLAASERAVAARVGDLDRDPWLFNVRNGTVDLRTGTLREHRRTDRITRFADVDFDPESSSPIFQKFLAHVQPDPAVREYLQRFIGYALTGVIREHVLPINFGTGRNGKGVFTGAMQHVLGDYSKQIPTELLMAKSHDAHPTERAELLGLRFAVASETEQNRQLAVALVKQLTGGDRISARRMRQDFFEFDPSHKLWLTTNNRPSIRETSDAIWRRVHLIPWTVVIPEGQEDEALPEKLRAEASGILAWAVRGCLNWQQAGLAPPPAVTSATAQYRGDSDALGDFFSERCVIEAAARVSRAALRIAYDMWCNENGERRPLDATALAGELRARGVTDVTSMREAGKKSPTRGWEGIRLRSPSDDPAVGGVVTVGGSSPIALNARASTTDTEPLPTVPTVPLPDVVCAASVARVSGEADAGRDVVDI